MLWSYWRTNYINWMMDLSGYFMLRLVLLGRPGAGKGTQSEFISESFNTPKLVMSGLLKEEVNEGSSLGEIIRSYMEEGKLVPDKIVYQVLQKNIMEVVGKGFILDGFPRNLKQAEWLDNFLKSNEIELSAAIYFDVDELTVLRRIMGRLICESCGRAYNIFYDPPLDIRKCECGGKLYQRKDDCYEKILRRLNIFNEETLSLVEYYKRKGLLLSIDASKDIKTVKEETFSTISALLS